MKNQEEYKCDTCVYRAHRGSFWKCNYSEVMNHSRGCDPGNECTKYIKGERINRNNDIKYSSSRLDSLENFCDLFNHFN